MARIEWTLARWPLLKSEVPAHRRAMNTIPDATDEPRAYVEALLRTLGRRDPLDVYRTTADVIAGRCAELPEGRWHSAPEPDEWSAYQIVGHVFDVDIVY